MTDRQMKNGAGEFDAVTQQTCRPCSRRRYEPLRAVGEAAPKSPARGGVLALCRHGSTKCAAVGCRLAQRPLEGNPAAAFGSVLGCVRIRMPSRFNKSLPRQWLGRGDLRSR
jgi:hypothetical protein